MSLHLLGCDFAGADWWPAPTLDAVRAGLQTVKKGQKGDAVTYVQALVNVTADGEFGDKTEAAVKAFQQAHNLPVDGIVGKDTITAIDTLAGGTAGIAPLKQTFTADVISVPGAGKPKTAVATSSTPASTSHSTALVETSKTSPTVKKALGLALPVVGGLVLGGGAVSLVLSTHRLIGALIGGLAGASAGFVLYTVTSKKESVNV